MIPLHKMVSPYWNYIWCMRARPTVFCNCKRLVFASDHLTSDVKYYDKYILSNRRVLKCLTKIEINFCYKLHVWLNCNTCQLYSNEVFLVVVLLGTSDKTLSSSTDWGRPSQLTGTEYDCLLVVVMVTTWSREREPVDAEQLSTEFIIAVIIIDSSSSSRPVLFSHDLLLCVHQNRPVGSKASLAVGLMLSADIHVCHVGITYPICWLQLTVHLSRQSSYKTRRQCTRSVSLIWSLLSQPILTMSPWRRISGQLIGCRPTWYKGIAWKLLGETKDGIWGTKVPSEVQGQASMGLWSNCS